MDSVMLWSIEPGCIFMSAESCGRDGAIMLDATGLLACLVHAAD